MNFRRFMFSRADVTAMGLADNGFESRIFKYLVYFQHFVIRRLLKIEPLKSGSVIQCADLDLRIYLILSRTLTVRYAVS
jgi:hypothetical protein